MAKYGGKSASVTIAGVTMAGRKWSWASTTQEVEVTDYRSAATPDAAGGVWDDFLVGFSNATITVEVLWDDAVAIPAHGASVAFVGVIGGGHGVSCTAFYLGGDHGTDIKDAARRTIRLRQTGIPVFA